MVTNPFDLPPPSLAIVGGGNAASVFARMALKAGLPGLLLVTRGGKLPAWAIGLGIDVVSLDEYRLGQTTAHVSLLCVPDHAIAELSALLLPLYTMRIHCSGATPTSPCVGVMYPLQTLRSDMDVPDRVPLYLTFKNDRVMNVLARLVMALRPDHPHDVHVATDAERLTLHHAAVWANNFGNLMLTHAVNILKKRKYDEPPMQVLVPLLVEGLNNAIDLGPANAQTGPAKREDAETMERHMAQLSPEDAELYAALSNAIQRQAGKGRGRGKAGTPPKQ